MANPEHVELVKQGAKAIAAWREANPGERLEFQDADLQGANLQDADLQGANLQGANLQGANLQISNLQLVNFREVKLDDQTQIDDKWRLIREIVNGNSTGIDLSGADLSGAYLAKVDLSHSDLSEANLEGANLSEVKLDGTVLDGIRVDQSTLEQTAPLIPELLQAFVGRFSPDESLGRIMRTIEFPPEYRQAGIGIMNYFAEVMRQKYPDIPATVQITQEDLTVRMTIETDNGHREVVEKTLEEYGLVVSGQRQPADFLDDEIAVLRLENKLDVARAELQAERRANRMLERYGNEQKARIEHLEIEVSELRRIVGNSLTGAQEATHRAQETNHLLATGAISHNQNLAALFDRHLASAPDSETLRQAMSAIQTLAERAAAAESEARLSNQDKAKLTQVAADIQAENGTYWNAFKGELTEFFKNAGAGVGGNYATDAVKDFIEIISAII